MERREYAILSAIGLAIISGGVMTTTQPIGQYMQSALIEWGSVTVTMVWITWWALVLGFSVAGAVEAWIPADAVAETLSGNDPKTIGLASFFGFISSSCSYSAIATAKNLFKKGASASASVGAFMFASTNLVIEVGFVILILLGWEFLVANYVGGIILIILMAILLSQVPDSLIQQARDHIPNDEQVIDPVCGMEFAPEDAETTVTENGETYYFCSESCKESFDPTDAVEQMSLREKATSRAGWERLASKQWSEWGMLWEDIAVGFIFAGLIAAFVPDSVWTTVFAQELFGFPAALIWGCFIGAIIGIATFVCSVGNVPFAAVLWVGGLPFGGVFSYIYADLIVPPIVDAYREYYGVKFGLILAVFIFISAVITGIVTHLIFAGIGLIPPQDSVILTTNQIKLDYKAFFNALFTLVFIGLYYLHRNQSHEHHE